MNEINICADNVACGCGLRFFLGKFDSIYWKYWGLKCDSMFIFLVILVLDSCRAKELQILLTRHFINFDFKFYKNSFSFELKNFINISSSILFLHSVEPVQFIVSFFQKKINFYSNLNTS